MHLYRFSFSGVDNFISLHAGLSTKTNYVKHELFSRSITLLVIISRISNNLRCKTCFLLPSQEKNVVYLSTYLHTVLKYSLTASPGLDTLGNVIPQRFIHCANDGHLSTGPHCILVIITATSRKAEILQFQQILLSYKRQWDHAHMEKAILI